LTSAKKPGRIPRNFEVPVQVTRISYAGTRAHDEIDRRGAVRKHAGIPERCAGGVVMNDGLLSAAPVVTGKRRTGWQGHLKGIGGHDRECPSRNIDARNAAGPAVDSSGGSRGHGNGRG